MTGGWTDGAAAAALAAVVAVTLWRFVLRRLPEPDTDEGKRTYTSLTGRSETVRVAICAAAAGAASALLASPGALPQWLVLATAGFAWLRSTDSRPGFRHDRRGGPGC